MNKRSNFPKITGLIVAPFTPMNSDFNLNLRLIETQANLFKMNRLKGVFICGTTGESLSLTVAERMKIAEEWGRFTDKDFKLIVHVGHNCLEEAKRLANHAQKIGATAIGTMPPTFFKPASLKALVEWCYEISSAAPDLPLYYYHIPTMTGLTFLMHEFLFQVENKIPNLAGIKFTHDNLLDLGFCLTFQNGKYDILFGRDEILLSALVCGVKGAVGSFYNFLAPTFIDIIKYFNENKLDEAKKLQSWIQKFTKIYIRFGNNVAIGKAIMKITGLDCGPVRLPLKTLSNDQYFELKKELDAINFRKYAIKIE